MYILPHSERHTHRKHASRVERPAQPQDRAQGPWGSLSEVPGPASSGSAPYRFPEVAGTAHSAADPAHSYSATQGQLSHRSHGCHTGHMAAGTILSGTLSPTGFRGRVCNQVPHHRGPAISGDSLSQSPSVLASPCCTSPRPCVSHLSLRAAVLNVPDAATLSHSSSWW